MMSPEYIKTFSINGISCERYDDINEMINAINVVYNFFNIPKHIWKGVKIYSDPSDYRRVCGTFSHRNSTINIFTKNTCKDHYAEVLSHELGHYLDFYMNLGKGNRFKYSSSFRRNSAGVLASVFRVKSGSYDAERPYWKKSCECLARAVEQYFAIEHNHNESFFNKIYYCDEESYKSIRPFVEDFLKDVRTSHKG